MKTLDGLIQGSPEWVAVRASYLCASEASAMLGVSPQLKRSELLHMKSTGAEREFGDWVQRNLLDKGHEIEALARPIVEGMIGEELYPVTGVLEVDGLPLLASFDGITMMEDASWENKMWDEGLAAAVRAGDLDPHYWAQLEQQLLVSGAERAFFTTSDGTAEGTIGMWYESVPERRTRLIAGWKQFVADLAGYVYVEPAAVPVAAPIMELPALVVSVEGRVVSSNLALFKDTAGKFIDSIKTDLQTDQDFADAEGMVKFCKDGEDKLELVKSQALAQTASIDELFRTIEHVKDELRAKRLELDKLVKTRKESIRVEIALKAKDAMAEHIATLNKRLGKPYMPAIAADFAGAMKGKKTVATLRDAADTELARAKAEASTIADQIQINLNSLRELAKDHAFLFADTPAIVLKANDDLLALIKSRITDHQAEQERQQEAERARIRQEELAKIERERRQAEAQAEAQRQREAAAAAVTQEAAKPAPVQEQQTAAQAPTAPRAATTVAAQAAAATGTGTDTAETIVLAFIDAYESGSGIFTQKVYQRAKAWAADLQKAA